MIFQDINKANITLRPTVYTKNNTVGKRDLDLLKALLTPKILYINVTAAGDLRVNYQLINTIGKYEVTTDGPNEFKISFPDLPPIDGSPNMGVQLQSITNAGPLILGLVEYYSNEVYLNVINCTDNSPSTTGGVYEAFIRIEIYDTYVNYTI